LTVDAGMLHSRARNTAFEGRRFQGRVSQAFVGGNQVFNRA
jgi:dihydroorotase-like cyclic amidohydrolase